jgi:hypothetical protein
MPAFTIGVVASNVIRDSATQTVSTGRHAWQGVVVLCGRTLCAVAEPMRKIIAVAVAASLTSCGTPPPPSATVTVTIATPTRPASPSTPSPSPSPPPPPTGLRPGPHSAVADIDLPAGTVPETSTPDGEMWSYSAPYDDVVAFLQRQFATGRRYDDYGATWWNGLPPCYNDTKYNPADPAHESPPRGWVDDNGTEWRWSDGAATLDVLLTPQGVPRGQNGKKILVGIINESSGVTCNRA